METYETFATALRRDAYVFATNLSTCPEEVSRLVEVALAQAYVQYRESGFGAPSVWIKCVIYRNLLDAAPSASEGSTYAVA
jgi:hypothetical protein